MLRSLFRPKWQHKDPLIRSQAVAALNPNQDGEVLYQIALADEEQAVRQIAISRISQLKLLHQLYLKTSFAADKPHIQQCWCSVLSDADLTTAVQAENIVLDCQEPHWLAAIVRHSNNTSLKHLALTGLRDETLIFQLLEDTKDSHLWQLLVQQLDGEDALKKALNIIKGRDKKTTQLLRQRLDEIQKEQQEQLALKEQTKEIEERLQQLLNSEFTPLLEGILLNIEQQLQQSELASEKASALLMQCQEKLKEQLQLETSQQAKLAQRQLAESLYQTLNKELSLNDEELEKLSSLTSSDDEPTQQIIQKTHNLLTAINQFEHLQQTISQQNSNVEKFALTEQAIALVKNHSALKKQYLNILEQQAKQFQQQAKQQRQTQQESTKTLEQLIQQAEDAIASSDFALVQKLYNQVRKEFNKLGNKQRQPFNAAFQRIQASQAELHQWQEFATDPLREELCQAMEKIAANDDHPRDKAKNIKTIQQQWKKLGYCHDQQLWQRFQALSDQAYEPCKNYFAEQKTQKQFNAQQCEIICQQIESFQQSIDWQQVDFRSLDKLLKNIEQEWKKYNFLEQEQYQLLQQRYNNAINPLKEKIKQHKQLNTEKLKGLVDQAKALLELDDSHEALNQYQTIHEQWKAIGISFFKTQRDLWQQLRQVGDALYQRRNQQRDDAEEQLQANLLQAQSLIEAIKSCDNNEQLKQLQQDYQALGGLPKNQYKTLQSQYQAAVKQYQHKQQLEQLNSKLSQLNALLAWSEQCKQQESQGQACTVALPDNTWSESLNQRLQASTLANQEQLQHLCIEAEILANISSPKEDEALRMKIQMQQLQAHFSSGQNEQALDKLSQLIVAWASLSKGHLSSASEYQQRFVQAVNALKSKLRA